MRGILSLLLLVAIAAVGLIAFLAYQKDTGNRIIVMDRPAVVDPNTTNPNVAPVNPADPNSTTIPQQPADDAPPYMKPEVNTIDASKPTAETNTSSAAEAPAYKHSFDSNGIFTLKEEMAKNGFKKGEESVVVVDKGSHFTYVLQKQGDKVVIVWRASNAIGTEETPSPPGPYKITEIAKDPVWVPTKSIDPEQKPVKPYSQDKNNPLGVGRIRLDKFQVALHGTNAPKSIRTDASHGCIRHSNNDITKIMSMVERGDTVIITEKFVGTKLSKDMFEDA
jgi:lipoprotein-anchoring transpeptidase ErfK/SrfK